MRGRRFGATGRALALLFVSVALFALGRAVGSDELLAFAVAGGATLVAALAMAMTAPAAAVQRTLTPRQVTEGESATLRYGIAGRAPGAWPVLRVTDALTRADEAAGEVLVPDPAAGAVDLSGLPRGIWSFGPALVVRADPLGLFERRFTAGGKTELRVWPEVTLLAKDALTPRRPPDVAPEDPDLRALRPYRDGDDVRRVHWRATARRGRPVVREDESPPGPLTVVLDTRADVYPTDTPGGDAAFETAVRAAAAAVGAGAGERRPVHVALAAPGRPVAEIRPHRPVGPALDLLAEARVHPGVSAEEAGACLRRWNGGALVYCGGRWDEGVRRVLYLARRGGVTPVLVLTAAPEVPPLTEALVVRPTGPTDVAAAWSRALLASAQVRGRR